MIQRQIHSNKISVQAFMILLIILAWLKPIIHGNSVNVDSFVSPMPLWGLFSFLANSQWLAHIFNITLIVIISISINRISYRYGLFSKQTAMPGVFFALIVGSLTAAQQFTPLSLASLLFLSSLIFLFDAIEVNSPMEECFLAAFWLSVSGLLSYKMLILCPFVLFLMANLGLLTVRNILAAIIGVLVPLLLLLTYLLSFGSLNDFWAYVAFSTSKVFAEINLSVDVIIYLSVLILLTVISTIVLVNSYSTKKINVRKYFRVITICSVMFLFLLIVSGFQTEVVALIALPLSLLLSYWVDNANSTRSKNIIIAFLFIAFLCSYFFIG